MTLLLLLLAFAGFLLAGFAGAIAVPLITLVLFVMFKD